MVDYQQTNAMTIPRSKSLSSSHAEKRANHNAIERQRRETLNSRFMDLAQSIPALIHVRKPSKSVIVSRSIEYIQEQKNRIEIKNKSLALIRQQNEELKTEINRMRAEHGQPPVQFPEPIDLDLVYEANLEQKEVEYDEEDEESQFGSLMSPGITIPRNMSPQVINHSFPNPHSFTQSQMQYQSSPQVPSRVLSPGVRGHLN